MIGPDQKSTPNPDTRTQPDTEGNEKNNSRPEGGTTEDGQKLVIEETLRKLLDDPFYNRE